MIKTEILNQDQILEFIPQRDPIVMVSSLVDIQGKHSITEIMLSEGSLFATADGHISSYGVLEHIAQSYALVHGYVYGVCIGYIGRVRKLSIASLPVLNIPVRSYIEELHHMGNVTMINAEVKQGENSILTCEMYLHFNK